MPKWCQFVVGVSEEDDGNGVRGSGVEQEVGKRGIRVWRENRLFESGGASGSGGCGDDEESADDQNDEDEDGDGDTKKKVLDDDRATMPLLSIVRP
nr:hypothetical protein [Tanacetum cinerariifolium]